MFYGPRCYGIHGNGFYSDEDEGNINVIQLLDSGQQWNILSFHRSIEIIISSGPRHHNMSHCDILALIYSNHSFVCFLHKMCSCYLAIYYTKLSSSICFRVLSLLSIFFDTSIVVCSVTNCPSSQ